MQHRVFALSRRHWAMFVGQGWLYGGQRANQHLRPGRQIRQTARQAQVSGQCHISMVYDWLK
jgi:hypothetical protein